MTYDNYGEIGWTPMNDTATKPQEKELNVERRVAQLRELRAKMEEFEKAHVEFMSPYEQAKKQLEGALMNWLLLHKIKTTNTEAGNITWVDNTTYPIVDKLAFRGFVIENQEWDMLDWKANKTVVNDYAEAHKGEIPPGLKPNPHPHLRVSGPGKKKTSVKTKGFDESTPEEE
jgi:hypothetical protein